MRKFIVLMLLAMVSGGAAAEWVKIDRSGSGDFDIYADPSTIRRSGNIVKMWHMADYKIVQVSSYGNRFLALKAQWEYDCKDERIRTLYFTLHSGNMGNGNTVYSDDGTPPNWAPVSPDSNSENLWKIACGKQ